MLGEPRDGRGESFKAPVYFSTMEGALQEALRRAMRARVARCEVQTLAAYYEQMEALVADINEKIREPKLGKEAP